MLIHLGNIVVFFHVEELVILVPLYSVPDALQLSIHFGLICLLRVFHEMLQKVEGLTWIPRLFGHLLTFELLKRVQVVEVVHQLARGSMDVAELL